MQLLAIILYGHSGEQRIIRFKPGELNVVTGVSATGKSALLDIVDFCLGRSTVTMAVGPITDRVAWYAVLVQLPNGQAFVARPAAGRGRATSQVAMLELSNNLSPLPFSDLEVNADVNAVRAQLGSIIGIEENETLLQRSGGRDGYGLEANLGHAMLLCLQGQGEIGNRDLLFHRQGEPGIADAIRATLPYFLGAAPRNQGLLRQELQEARRQLRRSQDELQKALAADEDMDIQTRSLVAEGIAVGLIPRDWSGGQAELVQVLDRVLHAPLPEPIADDQLEVERAGLVAQRTDLRERLRNIGEQVVLLQQVESDGTEYGTAVARQVSRLNSINLLGSRGVSDETCPICGSHLPEPDPNIEDLRRDVEELENQLRTLEVATPARRSALGRLESQADAVRQELRGVEAAIAGMASTAEAMGEGRGSTELQTFYRGRVQQFLAQAQLRSSNNLQALRDRARVRSLAVEELEERLNADEERDQVESRLSVIGSDMTAWADRLELEHQVNVRLDLRRLTVVTDTPSGPAPLFRIGSAENWVGYHLISHLALHRFFVREDRPVPDFLMLDQPTLAYYPSDVERETGVPEGDQDREAVQRLYELMRDVATELAPSMQVIVCDHANLPERWFQDAVVENWRDGDKLVPETWSSAAEETG